MDISRVVGITTKAKLIDGVLEKHYQKVDCFDFWAWNRKRRRGFYYSREYLDWMKAVIAPWVFEPSEGITDIRIFLPKKGRCMPLLVQIRDTDFFFVLAPRMAYNDKRLNLKLRKELAEEVGGILR